MSSLSLPFRPHVVIVDPRTEVREVCTSIAEQLGYEATGLSRGGDALQLLNQSACHIVVIEARLEDMRGIDFISQARLLAPRTLLIFTSATGDGSLAAQAIKAGACEYLPKPFEGEEFRVLLEAVMRRAGRLGDARTARDQARIVASLGKLVGDSPPMQKVFRLVSKVSQNRYPVLVLGESGTGKELVARAIHYQGPWCDRPFLPIDCGALSPTLIESELFGHSKGAFTGADRERKGLLAAANGGTVFLDEIGELPLEQQTKILRAIQEKEVRPLGSSHAQRIDVRVIAATNRNLETAVAEGTFRKDLFFRLNVVSIKLPPLRERPSDIPQLIEHFMLKANPSNATPKSFTKEALQKMLDYSWPGNVRELENCIDRAMAISNERLIQESDLPSNIYHALPATAALAPAPVLVRPMAEVERDAILSALTYFRGDKLLAAKSLCIGKTTLYRKLKEYTVGG